MSEHDLKTHPKPFQALWDGFKWAEYRKNDRDFKEGDILHLREWSPRTGKYLGRVLDRRVTYVGSGFGIPDGYCQMSLASVQAPSMDALQELRSELSQARAALEEMREKYIEMLGRYLKSNLQPIGPEDIAWAEAVLAKSGVKPFQCEGIKNGLRCSHCVEAKRECQPSGVKP